MKKTIISVILAVITAAAPYLPQISPLTEVYAAQHNAVKTEFDKTALFEDDEAWEAALSSLNTELLPQYRQAVSKLDTNEDVLNWVTRYDRCSSEIYDLYTYIVSDMYIDRSNSGAIEKYDRLSAVMNELDSASLEVYRNLNSQSEEFLEGLFSDERLAPWYRFLSSFIGFSEEELAETNAYMLMPSERAKSMIEDQYYTFRDVDLAYEMIQTPTGEFVPANYTNYAAAYQYKEAPEYGAQARAAFFRSLKNYENTFAGYLNSFVYLSESLAERYGYASALEMSALGDGITGEVLNHYISWAESNADITRKFSEALGKTGEQNDTENMQKDHAAIVESSDGVFEFEDARDILVRALAPLGEDYIRHLNKAFDSGWIDVYPGENKTSDNITVPGNIPCVIINYTGDYNSMSTLAHELGHAIHFVYSAENQQSVANRDIALITGEISALTNELLLARYMQANAKTDKERRLYLAQEYFIMNTNFFETAGNTKFEVEIHNIVRGGGTLTADLLNEKFAQTMSEFGGTGDYEQGGEIFWAMISQFYMPYYSKNYGLSAAAAVHAADQIESRDKQAVENYLRFLKSGDSVDSAELYKLLGTDLSEPDFARPLTERCTEIYEELTAAQLKNP